MNAKVTLICSRCGIDFTIKLDAYQKRQQRNASPNNCQDCRPSKSALNTADFWEFVKTTLHITAG